MARIVLLSTLRTWAAQLADVTNDPNIGTAQLTDLANRHTTEVYDLLVACGPPEYYAATTTVSTNAGTIGYGLPADFRSLLAVYANETSDLRRPILAMGTGERGRYKAPTNSWSFEVEYIPSAPVMSDAGINTFDGVSGWEELIAKRMAADIMIQRQQDPNALFAEIAQIVQRIETQAHRDLGAPKRVTDLDAAIDANWPWGWTSNIRVNCYRLRGSNLELFEPMSGLP